MPTLKKGEDIRRELIRESKGSFSAVHKALRESPQDKNGKLNLEVVKKNIREILKDRAKAS